MRTPMSCTNCAMKKGRGVHNATVESDSDDDLPRDPFANEDVYLKDKKMHEIPAYPGLPAREERNFK